MTNNRKWYRLDNTGKIYPSITSTRVSTVFRISATITTRVEPAKLQKALDNIIERFPYFKVNLRRGLFWYYFEYVNHNPVVKKEIFYPCMFMLFKKKKTFPFRILYYNKKISCEFSHSITDGTGALKFLQTLLVEYFRLVGVECQIPSYIFNKNSYVKQEEYEDSSHKYYKKNIPPPDYPKKAIHFPFKLNRKGEYYIITGIINVSRAKEESKIHGCSITEFLLAIYFETIQDYVYSRSVGRRRHLKRRIVINLPVNLRRIFPSNTMKNFFISITPNIDLRLGKYNREELIKLVKNYMEININEKHLSQYISRNVKNEKNKFIRIIPLFIKNMIMPIVYQRFGERGYTSGLSNLGLITMPREIENLIERFEFYPPPSKGNIVKMGIASYKDKIYISFGRLTKVTEIEKIFFRKIRKMDIPVKIETNLR
ncbi:hypothetical protein SH1V18_40340 [Vallitalea longa]|uniref:Alcohol acetyltransferase n=1 Tax=Vallitalea longa TaxID=2936439 RepID=A0A9W5YGK9_9FIRM|nr:hypothetical protein [Vallitalea longa]GKX31554.1 hypothetical protein SH1V18_40340 [Vallitalea longa]